MRQINRCIDFGPRIPKVIRTAALGFFVMGALGGSPVFAQSKAEAVPGPSAAGERFMMERAGLIPPREVRADQPVVAQVKTPSVAVSGAPLVFGLDVQVNDPTTDTPERTTQSETAMAVNGNTICAGYNDSNTGFSGLARSADLGATWTDLGGIGQSGDPVIAVHAATGTFYYAEIATIGGNPAIGIAVSSDDCLTFAAPVDAGPAASAISTTSLNDKPWIAVDNTGGANDGNIYVCWTRFDPNLAVGSELRVSRSTDDGATYTNEQILIPAGTAPFGCSVTMGPSGEVNVSWADRTGATANDIRFSSSTDAGVNYSAPISVSTGNRHPGTDSVVACGSSNRTTLTGNIRMLHQSWQAADNTGGAYDGNLYIVWASDPIGTPDNSDVFFSRSQNGGVNWSTPVQLGIEAGPQFTDQFEPFVAVGGTGTISVAWYDRRNDPANNNLIDVYKTFSNDGGATFDPIVRVTDVNFPPPPILPNFDPGVAQCYMGEYIAVAADANNFYYMWGDNRNTLVTTNFPGGRPDPDIFFEAEAIPGLNTPPVAEDDPDYVTSEDVELNETAPGVLGNDTDADGDPLTAVQNSSTSDGDLTLRADGSFDYDPDANFCGSDSFTYHANDGTDDSNVALVTITVTCVNDAPVAVDNNYTGNEDTQQTGNVIADDTGGGVDSDVDGDGLSIFSNTDVSHGTLVLNADGSFTYDPNLNYCGPDSFTYVITDDPPITPPPMTSNTATVSITVICVNDPPVVTSVVAGAQTSDYSDFIGTVVITVEDVDDTSTTLLESNEPPLSTAGLSLTSTGCTEVITESPDEDGSICTWDYDGQVKDPGDNSHGIIFTPSDADGAGTVTGTHTLTIEPEDATVILDDRNTGAVEVPEADGPSGPFSLDFIAWETNDVDPPVTDDEDFSHAGPGKADHGDLNNAQVFMSLVPVGPGGPITTACTVIEVSPAAAGYDQVLVARCYFDDVPVNVYEVIARVDGLSDIARYYFGESAEGVFVVFDPSLGFTTGGGWFYWPETYSEDLCGIEYLGDKTNFGFSMKYNKKRKNVHGSLLLMRHQLDAITCLEGNYKVKSNALNGMALGEVEDVPPYGWATFSGKATFREPGMDNTGGNPFLAYVEDHGEQGCNQIPTDEFWIEVKTKEGVVLLQLNGPEPADNDPANDPPLDGDDEPIECGNIIVPHKPKGKGKGKP